MTDDQDFARELAERAQRDAEQLKTDRAETLKLCQEAGLLSITLHYDGCGDSGMIHDHDVWPTTVDLTPELETQLDDFAWRFVYHLHPGFELNDGAFGTIEWDISKDEITVEHSERYTATRDTSHEGL